MSQKCFSYTLFREKSIFNVQQLTDASAIALWLLSVCQVSPQFLVCWLLIRWAAAGWCARYQSSSCHVSRCSNRCLVQTCPSSISSSNNNDEVICCFRSINLCKYDVISWRHGSQSSEVSQLFVLCKSFWLGRVVGIYLQGPFSKTWIHSSISFVQRIFTICLCFNIPINVLRVNGIFDWVCCTYVSEIALGK